MSIIWARLQGPSDVDEDRWWIPGPELPRLFIHRGKKNRQCKLLFVFLMASGIFTYYALCVTTRADTWTPCRNVRCQPSKPHDAPAQQDMPCSWHSCSSATTTEHKETTFRDWRPVLWGIHYKCADFVLRSFWMPSPPHSLHPVERTKKELLTINYNHRNSVPSFHS